MFYKETGYFFNFHSDNQEIIQFHYIYYIRPVIYIIMVLLKRK